MRRLIITNTYFQLILAMQMNNTIFVADELVVLMSDQSRNMDIIKERLNSHHIFSQVGYVKNKGQIWKRRSIDKLLDFFEISFKKSNRYNYYLDDIQNKKFDEIICFNYAIDIYGIFSYLYQFNKELKVSFYEEGILSYNIDSPQTKRRKIIDIMRRISGKKDIIHSIDCFYCFYPQLYSGRLTPVGVPLISKECLTAQQLKKIFQPDLSLYKYKYIFFATNYAFEGGKTLDEYGLICKISELIGKENLLIKMHPRDTRTIYADNGFNIDKNSTIPWEVMQLSGDFSDKVFITIVSGSVLAGSTMSEKPVRTYYLYRLCDYSGNEPCKKSVGEVEKLLGSKSMTKIFKSIKAAEKLEDII